MNRTEMNESLTARSAWAISDHGAPALRNHADASRFMDFRHAEVVQVAENILSMAATALGVGDRAAAADLMAEAKGFMSMASEIEALRA